MVILGKDYRFRKALAGNDIVEDWLTKHESVEISSLGIQTMPNKLGDATGIYCSAHSFRRGFCVLNVKSGFSTLRFTYSLTGYVNAIITYACQKEMENPSFHQLFWKRWLQPSD